MFSRAKVERLRSLQAWPMDEFPFMVFYESDDKEVRIYSLIHGKRDLVRLLLERKLLEGVEGEDLGEFETDFFDRLRERVGRKK